MAEDLSWEDTLSILHDLSSVYLSNDDFEKIQHINQKLNQLDERNEGNQREMCDTIRNMQNEQSVIAQNIEQMLKVVEERKLQVDETVRAKDELEHDLNKYESKVKETKTKLASLDEEATKIATDHSKIEELNAKIDHAENLLYLYKNITKVHWNSSDPNDCSGLIVGNMLKKFDFNDLPKFDRINQLWELYIPN